MHAMPVMLVVLCLLAIAYRYYSAFLAARVATLDDSRLTPAEKFKDGNNFDPTNKWVLFGHHFAAISGAGPLIGPVLAAQFGYMPGLIWIVVGVCLAGAVQDFLVLAASIRRGGRSLAQIAFEVAGPVAGWAAMIAILFIITIALAGLGKVVVKALGGETVAYPPGSVLKFPSMRSIPVHANPDGSRVYTIPAGTTLFWSPSDSMTFDEKFLLKTPTPLVANPQPDATSGAAVGGAAVGGAAVGGAAVGGAAVGAANDAAAAAASGTDGVFTANLPPGAVRLVPGSSWGTFTIACTVPIALFIGVYMTRIRKGKVLEASVIGAALTLAAVFLGGWIAESGGSPGSAGFNSPFNPAWWFSLSATQVVWAMAIYGFVAAVLPVSVLLCPRDYLSSFLKIGTIGALVIGTLIANPRLEAPALNRVFLHGGPIVLGGIFPFLFITIMCGAISGFHALVSSGTTPKMIRKESDARMIGYGAMLIEGLVGVVAMIAAATLAPGDYYAMNTDLANVPKYQTQFALIGANVDHLADYDRLTEESLRGRTGGAVTLAVGMAHIFDASFGRFAGGLWKYWYHFAIMFEALFILTTIDAGTRIGRFLLQEVAGKIHPKLGRPDWLPGALASTGLIVLGWAYFINANSFAAIWSMFGIANQMLAAIALSILAAVIAGDGKSKYLPVVVLPLLLVCTTTTTAALELLTTHWNTVMTQWASPKPNMITFTNSAISGGLIVIMLTLSYTVILSCAAKVWTVIAPAKTARVAELAVEMGK